MPFLAASAPIKYQPFQKETNVRLSTVQELGYQRAGYDFYRWLVVSNDLSTGVELSDGQELYLADEDVRLSGMWSVIRYGVNYYLDGGQNDPMNPSQYTVEDSVALRPASKDRYDFQYWYDSTGLSVRDQSIPKGTTGDIYLSAKFKMRFFDDPGLVLRYSNADGAAVKFEFASGKEEVGVEFNTEP